MTLKTAIEKAIEGGWKGIWNYSAFYPAKDNLQTFLEPSFIQAKMLLDPSFWSALGKTMGWGKDRILIHHEDDAERFNTKPIEHWLYHWHHFIDTLAEGKSIESFFEQLI